MYLLLGESVTSNEVVLALIAMTATLVGILGVTLKNLQNTNRRKAEGESANLNEIEIEEKILRIEDVIKRLELAQQGFTEKGWDYGLPKDLSSAPALTQTIRDLQMKTASLEEQQRRAITKLEDINQTLVEHLAWVQVNVVGRKEL
jgi:hypothetical protein